jgi:phosphatidate cytidylyltransferase
MMTRVISALVAVLIVAAAVFFFKATGLRYICAFVAIGSTLEYWRLTFARGQWPRHIQAAFVMICLLIYAVSAFDVAWSGVAFAAGTAVYFGMALLTISSAENLSEVLQICGMSAVGFLYCGLYAGFATSLLSFAEGPIWLFGLMAIVFSGDTCAYLAGRAFGKNKLLEPVSPKKTIEGAIGGLAGSLLAGLVLGIYFLGDRPLAAVVIMAVTTGAFAQIGDLFESLLKRVAEVKDSGSLMPGHGGILDRVDGLLFAAPIYYVLARFLVQ